MISQFLEQHTRALYNMDISDTASTSSTTSEDERIKSHVFQTKCLAEAFQKMFVKVVRNIPFDGVIDEVFSGELVTIVENQRARNFPQMDDGMRYLVMTVMNKDYHTMMKFLELVANYDPDLEKSIMNIFRERYEEGQTLANSCTACLIRNRVSIKHICDYVFTKGLISIELQQDVTSLTTAKANTSLWQRLCDELSSERTEYVLGIIKDALRDEEGDDISNHADIVRSIDRDIQKDKPLKCRCKNSSICSNSSPTVSKGEKIRPPNFWSDNSLGISVNSDGSTHRDARLGDMHDDTISNRLRLFGRRRRRPRLGFTCGSCQDGRFDDDANGVFYQVDPTYGCGIGRRSDNSLMRHFGRLSPSMSRESSGGSVHTDARIEGLHDDANGSLSGEFIPF